MASVDIIARGIAASAKEDLKNKADLVNGKVPEEQLPSYVDEVIEVENYAALPRPGLAGKIYVTKDDRSAYRWSGTDYFKIPGGISYTAGDGINISTDNKISVTPNKFVERNQSSTADRLIAYQDNTGLQKQIAVKWDSDKGSLTTSEFVATTVGGGEGKITATKISDGTTTKLMSEILSGSGGTGYFLAKFNETPFSDVLAAYQAGKIIDAKADMEGFGTFGFHLNLIQFTNNVPSSFWFSQLILDTAEMTLSVDAGGWHSNQISLERQLVAGSAVGFDSEIGTARTVYVKYDNNTIKVNSEGKLYTTTAGTSVIANPTLTGGEAELTSIQIGDTKYSNLNYHPFPESFDTTHTLKEFGQSIVNYENFATGCTWFGGIECTDLPGNMMQVECKVTALRDTTDFVRNIAVVEIFSSEVAPFHWTYNTDSWEKGTGLDDWKYVAEIDESKFDASATTSDTYNVKVKKVNAAAGSKGWEFYTEKSQDELPAYPTDTEAEYVLALKYENNAWVKYWKEIANKSDVVDKGTVDYMVIKS